MVLLLILMDCVTNANSLTLKGCHVPLTAFYRPVKALIIFFITTLTKQVQDHSWSNCEKDMLSNALLQVIVIIISLSYKLCPRPCDLLIDHLQFNEA